MAFAETDVPLMMKFLRLVFLLLVTAFCTGAVAQDFSNKGKEFYVAYPSHVDGNGTVMGLYITSSVNTTGTVTPGSGPPINFSVQANVVTRVFLNKVVGGTAGGTSPVYYGSNVDVYLDMADGIKTSGSVKIVAQDPIVVYSHIIFAARSGATLVLPTQVLGSEYILPSMPSNNTQAANSNNNGSQGGIGELVVVATQDNTTVDITPTAGGRAGKVANATFQVTLAKAGDSYQFQSINLGDISGTRVASQGCKPIAVFSATTWSAFDCNGASGGDNLYQQVFPTRAWGKNFVTAPFYNRPEDIFRIFVKNASATVSVTEQGITTTLGASNFNANGKFYTYRSNKPLLITGSEPISVAQYITSATCKPGCSNTNTPTCYADPEMVILNPIEQTLQNVTFFSAIKSYLPSSGISNVDLHYVNIIVGKKYTSSVKIDNAAPKGSFVDIPGSNYAYLQEDLTSSSLSNPIHNVSADSNFVAIVYGYGSVESYGYNGGTNVKDISPGTTFQTAYSRIDSAVTCVNTPLQFSVPIGFKPASISWDFSAAPNITPNAGVGPVVNPTPDSTVVINGQTLNYFSTGKTFTFTNANNVAVRDTIKVFTVSAATDGCGTTNQSFTIPVTVRSELPVARFAIDASPCVRDGVKFTDQSIYNAGSIIHWLWDFGDGTTADLKSATVPDKVYTSVANYTVKLKVVSDIGCLSSETSQAFIQSSKPVANFSVSPVKCPGTDVTFIDASSTPSGTIVKWTWDTGEGNPAIVNTTNAPFITKFTTGGTKSPTLKVTTSTGCESDVFTSTFDINPNPVPGFILPEVCLSDAFAQFTDTSKISDGSQAQFKWAWKFNAGTPAVSPGPSAATSNLQNPQIKYNKSDNYQVSLTVTSKDGCMAETVTTFTVNGSIPKAAFDFVDASPFCGVKPVRIKNNSTVDFGNVTRLEIFWDDGNSPTVKETDEDPTPGKIYSHAYPDPSSPKAYVIRVVAYSGGSACADNTSKTFTLYPQPKAAFTSSVSQLCTNEVVSFTDNSAGGPGAPTSWNWNLGGGVTSALQNPTKKFTDSGLINVSMYFYNADGCISDTAVKQLQVYPNPVLALEHSIRVLAGGTVTLVPLYVYGNQPGYKWTPSTWLTSDTALSPKAVPLDDITYKLTVTADGGCTVSDTIQIRVLKGPEVPNAFSPNGDGINDTWQIKYLDSYPDATVEVYGRSGQLVFRSTGSYTKAWDGTRNGTPLPVGTYYYIINPRNGRPVVSGSVTIIR